MAGDWMKIELELPDKPEVHHMAGVLGIDPDAVVGKLLRVWAWFDKHTRDGNAHGVTYALLDRITSVTGFGEAMASVGWMNQKDQVLVMPKFDAHTSKSAKTRALTKDRVVKSRNAGGVTGALPEKRREEKEEEQAALIPLADGTEFVVTKAMAGEWSRAYPRIDVLGELRKARAWCLSNERNRKTRSGANRFLNSWLSRADDDAATKPIDKSHLPGGGRRAL
jgi:hypothetical protein